METLIRSPKDLGNAIRRARKTMALTQSELASRSGIWQETISKIENGVSSTKLDTIFDLFAALDLEIQIQKRSKGNINKLEEIF